MENLIGLLKSTEELLTKANRNLTIIEKITIESTNLTKGVATKLNLLSEKHTQVEKRLKEKKQKVLEIIIQIARAMKISKYDDGVSEHYTISPSSDCPQPIKFGYWCCGEKKCDISEFCQEIDFFYGLCETVLRQVPKFVEDIASQEKEISKEIKQLNDLISKMKELERIEII